jgi:parallel beta-helix repeat protein
MRTLLVNVLRWAVLAAPIVPAVAAVIDINNADPGCNNVTGAPFCSISAGLNAARPFDSVRVFDGVYHESIRIRTDDLTVNGVNLPTINGAKIEAIRVSFFGFDVQGGGIVATTLPGSSNCTEVGIGYNQATGIAIDHCEGATINNNTVNGGGISVSFSGNVDVVGNTVNAGSGFSLFMSSGATLLRNIARDNRGDGFFLRAADDARLNRNIATGNGENGFRIDLLTFATLKRNRAIGNRFYGIRQIARHPGDPEPAVMGLQEEYMSQ